MPRHRFSWDNLHPALLRKLKPAFPDQPDLSRALRSAYGARPSPDFVRDHWPVLLEEWLRRDRQSRAAVVDELRHARLGDVSINTATAGGQMDYLRSCRNASSLREIVRTALIQAGESPPAAKAPAKGTKRRVGAPTRSRAWQTFTTSLASTLGALLEDSYLILTKKDGPGFVQFAAHGAFGMRAEMVSNAYLPNDHQLSEAALKRARALGWTDPTGSPEASTPEADPDGSPNHFCDWEAPVPYIAVARLAVDTLVDVLGVHHPSMLRYSASTREGTPVLLPTLGLQLEPGTALADEPAPTGLDEIRGRVLELLRGASGTLDLAPDDDGDIPLVFGSAMVFVRVFGDPPIVRVFSQVLSDVQPTPALVAAVNDLNMQYAFTKWIVHDDSVVAAVELFAVPLTEQHVLHACGVVGEIANEVDEQLQQQFGGRTFLGEYQPPASKNETLGYL